VQRLPWQAQQGRKVLQVQRVLLAIKVLLAQQDQRAHKDLLVRQARLGQRLPLPVLLAPRVRQVRGVQAQLDLRAQMVRQAQQVLPERHLRLLDPLDRPGLKEALDLPVPLALHLRWPVLQDPREPPVLQVQLVRHLQLPVLRVRQEHQDLQGQRVRERQDQRGLQVQRVVAELLAVLLPH
jgi:hypothetical protein